ncbi:MAG TPA: endonuclease [Pirellulaceae bacterium]|jgi:hypothetical protein|nr:endonuclease [Pirellulaceae bacterium]
MAFACVAGAQTIEPDLHGADLMNALRAKYRPTAPKSYDQARQAMFSDIDNEGGKVRCVYTGVEVSTTGIPPHTRMNTEHTWPQSLFGKRSPMRADLHHLFPTLNRVNGERDNHPFREIPDFETDEFYDDATPVTTPPALAERDRYSESDNRSFEPREDHEGDVARAMIYFWVIYANDGISPGFIDEQLSTLVLWHRLDPVDQKERERNDAIKAVQGNHNPFVLDQTLVDRVLGTSVAARGGAAAVVRPKPAASASDALTNVRVDVACWNMQSDWNSTNDESDEDYLSEQLGDKEGIRLWGFSEVANASALEKFRAGAGEGEGEDGEFVAVLGTTGGRDRLAIVYDSTIFEQVGPPFELVDETRLSSGLRASLGLHLRGVSTGQEFLFVVNHLKRGGTNDPRKIQQSKNLNAWVKDQSLPVILVGDFNYDYQLDGGGWSRGFDHLTRDGAFRWIEPENSVRTQVGGSQFEPSMLDFIFVANEPFGWTGFSEILERDGNVVATEVDFDDDRRESDHRPVRATLIFEPSND